MNRSRLSLILLPAAALSLALIAPEARAGEPLPVAGPGAPATTPVFVYGESPAPPGYHYENKRFLAPIIGGGVTLGVGWAASAVTGLLGTIVTMGSPGPSTDFGPMFVPIAGPFITLGMQPAGQRSDGFTAAALAMGGAQVVGASFLVVGLAMGKDRVLVEDDPYRGVALSISPVVGPSLNGVTLQGSF